MMSERWRDPVFKAKMRQARWGEHIALDFPQRHPTQRCACGCGELVPLYNQTKRSRGIVKGQPAKFVHGHNAKRERNNNWNGGRTTNGAGYVRVRRDDGSYEYEHRVVAEEKLGRSLAPGEVVHHVDGDRGNNTADNLIVFPSNTDHLRFELELKKSLL